MGGKLSLSPVASTTRRTCTSCPVSSTTLNSFPWSSWTEGSGVTPVTCTSRKVTHGYPFSTSARRMARCCAGSAPSYPGTVCDCLDWALRYSFESYSTIRRLDLAAMRAAERPAGPPPTMAMS